MPFCVCTGALLQCTFGAAPASFSALPTPRVMTCNQPSGVMTDSAPAVNVPPFGMCQSLSNPTVAAATSAAMGVLTPQPCIPVPAGPWLNTSTKVQIGGCPALTNDSKLICAYGGQISVQFAGQTSVQL